jgi:hypothetical protein
MKKGDRVICKATVRHTYTQYLLPGEESYNKAPNEDYCVVARTEHTFPAIIIGKTSLKLGYRIRDSEYGNTFEQTGSIPVLVVVADNCGMAYRKPEYVLVEDAVCPCEEYVRLKPMCNSEFLRLLRKAKK